MLKTLLKIIFYIIGSLIIACALVFFGVLGLIAYTFMNYELAFIIFTFILISVISIACAIVYSIKEDK